MTASRRAWLAEVELYLIATVPQTVTGVETPAGSQWLARVERAVAGGARMVQLRHKAADTDARRAWLVALRSALGPECLLVVNDDLDAVHGRDGEPLADGLHLGREDAQSLAATEAPSDRLRIGLALARERLGHALVGTSTRALAEIQAARAGGADHVGFGAMAPTTSKQRTVPADPRELARCATALPDFPIFPIGGLSAANLESVLRAGVRRAAIGAGILAADDPRAAAAACLRRLRGEI